MFFDDMVSQASSEKKSGLTKPFLERPVIFHPRQQIG